MNKNKFLPVKGIPLFRLPSTKRNRRTSKSRSVFQLEAMTAANLIHISGINGNKPFLFTGKYNRAYPILKQLLRESSLPVCVVGTRKDLTDCCLVHLGEDWRYQTVEKHLPAGNGVIAIENMSPIEQKKIATSLASWNDHALVLCLGNGIQLDAAMISTLISMQQCYLLSSSLSRSVRDTVKVKDFLSQMDYLIISSCADQELLDILPKFQCEKVTNHLNLNLHRDQPQIGDQTRLHHRSGSGLFFGQDWTKETHPLFEQSELMELQNNGLILVYNNDMKHAWVVNLLD